jgi:hypothetical protein
MRQEIAEFNDISQPDLTDIYKNEGQNSCSFLVYMER